MSGHDKVILSGLIAGVIMVWVGIMLHDVIDGYFEFGIGGLVIFNIWAAVLVITDKIEDKK